MLYLVFLSAVVAKFSPKQIFVNFLEERNSEFALEDMKKLVSDNPHSIWAQKGLILLVKYFFDEKMFEECESSCNQFLSLYYNSKYLEYVMFLAGLNYYKQVFSCNFSLENVDKGMEVLEKFLKNFPKSAYRKDVQLKIKKLKRIKDSQYLFSGYNEQQNRNFLVAIVYYKNLLEITADNDLMEEAFYRIGECYLALGNKMIAKIYFAKITSQKWLNNYKNFIKPYL